MVIPGIILVFVCMVVGYTMAHGNLMALVQPAEFVTIFGMALGAMVISAPMTILKRCVSCMTGSLKGSHFNEKAFEELLVTLFRLFALARKSGMLALETHIAEPLKSDIISKYHSLSHNKTALDLMTETLRMVLDGSAQSEEIDALMESSIETYETESHMPLSVLQKVGDGLPGIGIVGAVLGIIITMGHIDGRPEEVGQHVASALVGTFLGVFLAYGLLNPIISAVQQQEAEEVRYLQVMKTAIASYATGASPSVAVEFARRAIFSFARPSATTIEKACKGGG